MDKERGLEFNVFDVICQPWSIKAVAAEHDNVKNRERPVASASAFVRSTKDPKFILKKTELQGS